MMPHAWRNGPDAMAAAWQSAALLKLAIHNGGALPSRRDERRSMVFVLWLWLVGIACPAFADTGFPPRPFVLANEQELAAVREELARPGWKAKLYHASPGVEFSGSALGIRSNADRWLKRDIVIPARGGHYHHFFCEDGTRLELPREPVFVPGPYRCPSCGRQYEGERFEAALRRTAHAWLAQAARDLALVHALERKPEYARKAAEILLKYADAYPGPHTSRLVGGIQYQSLCESTWVIPLAQAFDLIHPALDEPEREKITRLLETVAGGIRVCGTRGNWGSWHLSAVGVVGYATGNRELADWAAAEFKRQIRDELGDDGLWPESVHTYHFFPLRAFVALAEAAWHAGVDLYRWEAKPGKSLLSMFTAPLEFAYPDLRLPAINDGWFEAFVPPDFYELAQRRAPDPRYVWVLSESYRQARPPAGSVERVSPEFPRAGIYAFLFGETLPTKTPSPVQTSVNFPVLGIAALRSPNGAMLTFDYGPFLGHGQLDKMGITLFAAGQLWAADYGTPGYGASILPWFTGTLSHNIIVVDGQNQQRTRENQAEIRFDATAGDAVSSEITEAYPGVTHRRTVARAGDCFVIVDTLRSDTEHTYDFYLRSEGRLALNSPRGKPETGESPSPWIEPVQQWPPAREARGAWRENGKQLAFWLTGSGPVTVLTAKCPAETGARQVDLLIARQRGSNAQFVTVLQGCAARESLRVELRDDELSIRSGGARHVLRLAADGGCPTFLPAAR